MAAIVVIFLAGVGVIVVLVLALVLVLAERVLDYRFSEVLVVLGDPLVVLIVIVA